MLSKLLRGLRFWNTPEFAGPPPLDGCLVSADFFKSTWTISGFEFDPPVVSPIPHIPTWRHSRANGVPSWCCGGGELWTQLGSGEGYKPRVLDTGFCCSVSYTCWTGSNIQGALLPNFIHYIISKLGSSSFLRVSVPSHNLGDVSKLSFKSPDSRETHPPQGTQTSFGEDID